MSKQLVKGISFSESLFQGRLAEDPIITDDAAWVKLNTIVAEQQENGKFKEVLHEIPLVFLDKSKIDVVAKYMKKGKQIYVKSYYKAWEQEGPQHAFVVTQLRLGPDENYKPSDSKKSGPPLPP